MFPKLALSITSFIPLYSLMVFMYLYVYLYGTAGEITKKYIIISIVMIITIQFICSIVVNCYIKSKESSRISENEIIFNNINEDKRAYVNYMMTYLLPLFTFDLDKVKGFYILYTNILIMLFVIMNARAENFNFNVFLWVKGYSIYKGTNIDGYNKILLIKKKKFSNIRSNHTKYKFVSFGGSNDLYLCKKYNE
ncbi:hypothetical protein KPL47_08955 [Clostridium estertheticum]|uniref:hypothetical protein n=1 Tax=Clostridium estertheticum TaxID=238834 RepID=UPI001C0D1938|nr:hypothetical protein [Clostridium estertheticum]MBU3176501.1 hypothetical protein [Clostridium estertheticum]